MKILKTKSAKILAGSLCLALAACGGYVYTTVGGTVSGLVSGDTLVLHDDLNYRAVVSADGGFSFRVASNASYNITVYAQPKQTNCSVANGSGHMTSETPVTNISVTCVPNVPVKVTLSGLSSGTVVLYDNDNVNYDALSLSANGSGTFARYIPHGQNYKVTVATQPGSQVCTVQNGSGTVDNKNLNGASNVLVNCVAAVPVSVVVAGLGTGKTLVLADNGSDTLTASANASYTFANSILDGQPYAVTITTQPVGQTCSVVSGSGIAHLSTPAGASNIQVNCVNS